MVVAMGILPKMSGKHAASDDALAKIEVNAVVVQFPPARHKAAPDFSGAAYFPSHTPQAWLPIVVRRRQDRFDPLRQNVRAVRV